MKLTIGKRTGKSKGETKRLRREGKIPAVIYSRGKVGDNVSVDSGEYDAIIRSITKGSLATTVLTLVDDGGVERKVIVKGVEYHVTSYKVLHLDFEELHDDVMVNVKVPLEFTGVIECVGIKHGGVLRKVIRHMQVRCLPKDIPAKFELDVRNMEMLQSKRLSAIALAGGVKPLIDVHEVAVVIAKR